MHLAGETNIAASRQRVWEAVSDPERVAATGGGQATVEKIDDRHYRVTVVPAGLPMPVTVVLNVEITELTPPSRIAATIAGQVMGGDISGSGAIDLTEVEPKLTHAAWTADATMGGLLGGFEPMIQGPLQQAADKGMASLKARLEAEEAAAG